MIWAHRLQANRHQKALGNGSVVRGSTGDKPKEKVDVSLSRALAVRLLKFHKSHALLRQAARQSSAHSFKIALVQP